MAQVDFKLIAAAALASIGSLLSSWLPDGKKAGNEYKALNPTRADDKTGSFSIRLSGTRAGSWADFADSSSDAKGGDLISLYGYLHGLKPLDAAIEVAAQLGIDTGQKSQKTARARAVQGVETSSASPAKEAGKAANWVPVVPVPENAPPVPLAHIKRGKPDASWAYKDAEGRLLGYIWRFTTSDGGKEIVPFTFCAHSTTGAQEWRNVQFAEPRPLYVPGIELVAGKMKLLVSGEKCADAAHALVADRFDVVTWPGGDKAIEKVDWSRFEEGDRVIIWPDCDAQREKLSTEEKAAGIAKDSKPLLPEEKQSGMASAEKIAQKLLARGCIVRIVKIPAPGEKPDGWDVADAITDGWTGEQIKAFVLENLRVPAPKEPAQEDEKSISTASGAAAEESDLSASWRWNLFFTAADPPRIRECRENVFQLLQHHPDWQGCLAMDEFANVIRVRRDTPTGLKAGGAWDEDQDFRLGLWMASELRLFIKAEGMISSGVRACAMANKFHPVREWLDSLLWDGTSRLKDWLSVYAGVSRSEYSELIGRLFLIGAVGRIYQPGCKMDTALILEGLQGEGKSSVAKALFGEWFADTTFVMGDKDAYLALRGKWGYELAELDSFNRSESTRAKAFISSSSDNYRAPYDRVSKDWPRQCVFIGTTNQYEYFKDKSGNRRYWPVLCHEALDPMALKVMRAQLFAEAVALFKQGERWWPTKDEQQRLVTPEQEAREISDPWEIKLYVWLKESCMQDEVTSLDLLVGAIGMEVSKIDGGNVSAMRVGGCMRKLGWGKKRRTTGAREWVYTRPKQISSETKQDSPAQGGSDDYPF